MEPEPTSQELEDYSIEEFRFLCRLNAKLQQGMTTPGSYVDIKEDEIVKVCNMVAQKIGDDPMLLELSAPIVVVGDVHGQFYDLMRIFERMGYPSSTQYIFLGDYVDRGPQSVEIMTLLLTYKAMYPRNIFLLRGNHESMDICFRDGFKKEIKIRFGNVLPLLNFVKIFNILPIAAIIENRIFCVHGGISRYLFCNDNRDLREIFKEISRPLDILPNSLVCDLLWSDPIHKVDSTPIGWIRNIRGSDVLSFGHDVIDKFLQKFNLEYIFRGHEWHMEGFRYHNLGKLVTIFSAPNYCNVIHNDASVVKLAFNEQTGLLEKRISIFKPTYLKYRIPFMG